MKLVYQAILTPFENGEDGYTVEFPDIPGCITEGYSLAEALCMAEDAASGMILLELEEGIEPPSFNDHSDEELDEGQIMRYVALDINTYAEKYGRQAVKRTVSLPAWMDTFARKYHISLSKVLQESLTQIIQVSKDWEAELKEPEVWK